MNLDFGLEPLFSWYVVLLCLSGLVMVALAAIKVGEQSVGSRAFSAVAGVGFFGYGIYLGFIFDGGGYMMFFQAFILPALLVVNFIRTMHAKHGPDARQLRDAAAQPQYPTQPVQPQQPTQPVQPHPTQPQQGPPPQG